MLGGSDLEESCGISGLDTNMDYIYISKSFVSMQMCLIWRRHKLPSVSVRMEACRQNLCILPLHSLVLVFITACACSMFSQTVKAEVLGQGRPNDKRYLVHTIERHFHTRRLEPDKTLPPVTKNQYTVTQKPLCYIFQFFFFFLGKIPYRAQVLLLFSFPTKQ